MSLFFILWNVLDWQNIGGDPPPPPAPVPTAMLIPVLSIGASIL